MTKAWLSKYSGEIVCSLVVFVLTYPAGILTNKWLTEKSPDIVVRQYYNTVDTKTSVPKEVGELILEYEVDAGDSRFRGNDSATGVYLIEVENEGNAAEEALRLQAKFPEELVFYKDPDFKIYNPKEVTLDKAGFFMELTGFPKKAVAQAEFVPPAVVKQLCNVNIQVTGKEAFGRVEGIKGVKCD